MARAAPYPPCRRYADRLDPETMRSQAILERIADALCMPITALVADRAAEAESITQAADLVTAFLEIEGVDARRTCLAFVRAMARA